MDKRIILISGKKGSGKSSLSTALKKYLLEKAKTPSWKVWQKEQPLFKSLKFADPLYEAHEKVWDIVDRYKLIPREAKSRDLLISLGDFGRARNESLWADITYQQAKCAKAPFIIIDDLRYPQELFAFPEDTLRIRLECPEEIRKTRCVWGEDKVHSSETALDDLVGNRNVPGAEGGEFDYVFHTDNQTPEEIVEALAHVLDHHVFYLPRNIRWVAE